MLYILCYKYICGFKSIKNEDIEIINEEPIYMCCNDYKKALIHSIIFNLKKHLIYEKEYSKFFINNDDTENQIINFTDYDITELIKLYENIQQKLANNIFLSNHIQKICIIKQYSLN